MLACPDRSPGYFMQSIARGCRRKPRLSTPTSLAYMTFPRSTAPGPIRRARANASTVRSSGALRWSASSRTRPRSSASSAPSPWSRTTKVGAAGPLHDPGNHRTAIISLSRCPPRGCMNKSGPTRHGDPGRPGPIPRLGKQPCTVSKQTCSTPCRRSCCSVLRDAGVNDLVETSSCGVRTGLPPRCCVEAHIGIWGAHALSRAGQTRADRSSRCLA